MKSSAFNQKKESKCVVCRSLFPKKSMAHKVCSTECTIVLAERNRLKALSVAVRTDRLNTARRKELIKPRAKWVTEAQAAWNRYVRARDHGLPCCSCGAMPEQKFGGTMDCSHYRSRGSAPHLKFHLHNAAAACVKCNRYLGGNIAALRIGLIKKFGIAKVEAVESNNIPRKFDVEYLKRIKFIFTKKAKRLEAKNET